MPRTLSPDELKAAVDAGIIDAAQADKLTAMRSPSAPDIPEMLADEERFRFLNGFNDVFLTIGVLLVAGAFIAAAAPGFSVTGWLSVMVLAAAVFWVLSEILVRRMRAVLPGMALSVLFVAFSAAAAVIEMHATFYAAPDADISMELRFWRNPTLIFATPALVASILYYLRFRLPFTLALIALFAYAFLSKGWAKFVGVEATATPVIAFFYGLLVLAIALAYDLKDPRRTTRLSDCAFWLHLVAALFIVSPVIELIKQASATPGAASGIVLVTVLAFGVFALAVDRRALLVSSLTYFTVAVYDVLSGGMSYAPGSAIPGSFVTTLALVGGFVLVLGVFWQPLRAALMPLFRNLGLARYLPPVRS